MKNKVVISGLGLLTPMGIGVKKNWKMALKGKSYIRPIQSLSTSTLHTKIAGEIQDFNFQDYFPNSRANRMDRSTHLALVAAKEALDDAGLTETERADTGVFVGTCFSTIQTKESTYLKLAVSEEGMSPLIFLKSMDNAAAAEIAIQYGLKGINQTIITACSASTMALGDAYRLIREGYAERILVGGIEAPLTRFVIRGWEKLHLISDADHPKNSKSPFSLNRNGLILGEGAGFLMLESEKSAKKRSAKTYCSLIGFGTNCDAIHLATPDPESQSKAILSALADAKVSKKEIHYINLHGTGTKINDKIETEAVKKVWGKLAKTLPMSATKSQIGHTMGACGAIETALTVLMMENKIILPTVQYEGGDPDCDLDYVPNFPREAPQLACAVKLSFGFGGSNAVLVLKK
jgi:3-oxoacyl-[acyl-carrier-protein] synthase II